MTQKGAGPLEHLMTCPLARRAVLVAAGGLVLAACQETPRPGTGAYAPARDFSGEPFPVRLVNRDRFDPVFRPTVVPDASGEPPGTIVVDTRARHLYLVRDDRQALRFGIAVGEAGRAWRGTATVGRKAAWPAWYPTDEMRRSVPGFPARIPPGEANPLGARALYLHQGGRDTLYRIHGTSEPWTIGTEASSGCIRMFNEDVIALYGQVRVGARVIVR